MKQSEMQISEEDFIAQMATLDAPRSGCDIDEDGNLLASEEIVKEDW